MNFVNLELSRPATGWFQQHLSVIIRSSNILCWNIWVVQLWSQFVVNFAKIFTRGIQILSKNQDWAGSIGILVYKDLVATTAIALLCQLTKEERNLATLRRKKFWKCLNFCLFLVLTSFQFVLLAILRFLILKPINVLCWGEAQTLHPNEQT